MSPCPPRLSSRRRPAGQAMVEFGLVFPFLVVTIMAIIEFGLLLREYLAVNFMLTQAAKEASLLRGVSDFDLRVARSLLGNAGGLDPSRLTINLPGGGTAGPLFLSNGVVVDALGNPVAQPAPSFFFLDDNETPGDTSDDTRAGPGAATADYARISVTYLHRNYGPYPDFMGIREFSFTQEKTVRLE